MTDLTKEEKTLILSNFEKDMVIKGGTVAIEPTIDQIKFFEKEGVLQLVQEAFLRQIAIDSVEYNKSYSLVECFAEELDYKMHISEVHLAIKKINESLQDKIKIDFDDKDEPQFIISLDGKEINLAHKGHKKRTYSYKGKQLNYIINDHYEIINDKKLCWITDSLIDWLKKECDIKQLSKAWIKEEWVRQKFNSETLEKWVSSDWIKNNLKKDAIKQWENAGWIKSQNFTSHSFNEYIKNNSIANNSKPWFKYKEIDIEYGDVTKNASDFHKRWISVKTIISEIQFYIKNNVGRPIFFEYHSNQKDVQNIFNIVLSASDSDIDGTSDVLRANCNNFKNYEARARFRNQKHSYNLFNVNDINKIKLKTPSKNDSLYNEVKNNLDYLVESTKDIYSVVSPSASFVVGTNWIYFDSFIVRKSKKPKESKPVKKEPSEFIKLKKLFHIENIYDEAFIKLTYEEIAEKISDDKNLLNSFLKLKRSNYIVSYLNNKNIKYTNLSISRKKNNWFISVASKCHNKKQIELTDNTSNAKFEILSNKKYNNSPVVTVERHDGIQKSFPNNHIAVSYNEKIKRLLVKIGKIQTKANNLLKDLSEEEQIIKRSSCKYKKLMMSVGRYHERLQNLVKDRRHQVSHRVVNFAKSKTLNLKGFHIKAAISYEASNEQKSADKRQRKKNVSVGAFDLMTQIEYKNKWAGGSIIDLSVSDKKEDKKTKKPANKAKTI